MKSTNYLRRGAGRCSEEIRLMAKRRAGQFEIVGVFETAKRARRQRPQPVQLGLLLFDFGNQS
jgi:hypothetical protein